MELHILPLSTQLLSDLAFNGTVVSSGAWVIKKNIIFDLGRSNALLLCDWSLLIILNVGILFPKESSSSRYFFFNSEFRQLGAWQNFLDVACLVANLLPFRLKVIRFFCSFESQIYKGVFGSKNLITLLTYQIFGFCLSKKRNSRLVIRVLKSDTWVIGF